MPSIEESKVYKTLRRIVDHWNAIPIRVLQDEKWQSLYLSEIKDDNDIAKWVRDLMAEQLLA